MTKLHRNWNASYRRGVKFRRVIGWQCTIRNGKRVEVRGGGEENRSEGSLKAEAKVKGKKREGSL